MSETTYRIVGKFGRGKLGEFGESSVIHQTKTIQLIIYNCDWILENRPNVHTRPIPLYWHS